MSDFIVGFGRKNGKADKYLFPETKTQALRLANALSLVLLGEHFFKGSDCTGDHRFENDEFYVQLSIRRPRTQFGRGRK